MDAWRICSLITLWLTLTAPVLEGTSDYEDDIKPSWGRCPWIRDKLKNGRVKIRSRGRIAKFFCNEGYEMVGKRFATCVRGHWNNPVPICVARGCYKLPEPANAKVTEMYLGALLVYDCLPGYVRLGPASLYCDGSRWSEAAPVCEVTAEQPQASCDFEDPEICGWTNDPSHDSEWHRKRLSEEYGHSDAELVTDAPDSRKLGFYMHVEASSPRQANDSARLFSPVFPPQYSPGCFVFWYRIYGEATGGLLVYIKRESQNLDELAVSWEKSGSQGNNWKLGSFSVPYLTENFQGAFLL